MENTNNTLSCPLWPDSPHRCTVLMILLRLSSSLSLLGCLFVIAIVCLFRLYKFFVLRLVLFLSISAAFMSISYLITDIHSNRLSCQFQAFIMQYFSWSTILWVIMITISVVLSIKQKLLLRYEKYFHLISWLLPFFWSALPFIGNSYGRAGIWCWIKNEATELRFGTWLVPKFIVILFLVISYSYILFKVLRQKENWGGAFNPEALQNSELLIKEVKQLAAYPLIYLFLSVPAFVYRILDATPSHDNSLYLPLILSVLTSPSNGAINTVVFAFYGEIQKKLTLSQFKLAILSWFRYRTSSVIHNIQFNSDAYVIPTEYNQL